MRKKALLLLISLLLTSAILPACSKEVEDGTISDITLDAATEEPETAGIFTKTDSPYDYMYESFSIKKARMKFDVPSSWATEAVNSRYIRAVTPDTDPFLPGVTLNILCNYGEDVSEGPMSEYTLNNHAHSFPDFFRDELEHLPYYVDGKSMHLRKYVLEDRIKNGLEFVDSEHAEDATTLITDSVVMMDKASSYYSDYSFVATYVKWDNAPFCFSMVVPTDLKDSAVSMVEYIVSSIIYDKDSAEGFKAVSYENFTTAVPESFWPVEGAENVFISSLLKNKASSGMAVGIFKIENKKLVTAENIADSYGNTIASFAFNPYGVGAIYSAQADAVDEEDGPDFRGLLTVNCNRNENQEAVAGSVFGSVAYYYADYYKVEHGSEAYLVAVIYQDCQKELADKVGKAAVSKLRVK